jgi:hypothetical protein
MNDRGCCIPDLAARQTSVNMSCFLTATSFACECGTNPQTVNHVVFDCPRYAAARSANPRFDFDDNLKTGRPIKRLQGVLRNDNRTTHNSAARAWLISARFSRCFPRSFLHCHFPLYRVPAPASKYPIWALVQSRHGPRLYHAWLCCGIEMQILNNIVTFMTPNMLPHNRTGPLHRP